ncbi:MAG: hypothetical protein HYY65_11825 [Candidatus Tectomicrobia bacterium]|uniref:Glucose-6-phosphate isomerase n=1 Tax=Tectimicrobiota bacterium TaxID=2528274 RepID=A0A932GR64_UNCTE|nr:hypothetical protein [Candidatus Tectomicrobia bacterium]
MAIHLYTENWIEPPASSPTIQEQFREAEAYLNSPPAIQERISRHQGGAPIPSFATVKADLETIAPHIEPYSRLRHIVVVGNGGSIRNVWALYQAILEGNTAKKIHVLDSTEPTGLLGRLLAEASGLSPENTLIIAVSKSGNTENVLLETEILHSRRYPILVVTSQSDRARLYQFAVQRRLPWVAHPEEVGGRFTAGQINSLLPLSILDGGLETVSRIVQGLEQAYELCAPGVPLQENPAKDLALRLFRAELLGFCDLFLPIYCQKLMGIGELIVQLCHETFGKDSLGISVVMASAPESQHHTNQRFFGGRRNMVGISLQLAHFEEDWKLNNWLGAGEFLALEHMGVVEEARAQGLPWAVLTVDDLAAEDIGKLIGFWQYTAVYSALVRGSNPFDQPAVEGSKRRTSELMTLLSEATPLDLDRYKARAAFHL